MKEAPPPHSLTTRAASRERWLAALRRVGPPFLLLFMVLQGGLLWFQVVQVQVERLDTLVGPGGDYVAFYAGGKLVSEGRGDELYDLQAIHPIEEEALGVSLAAEDVLPFLNPPFLALVLAPLSLMSSPAFAIGSWLLVVALMLLAGWLLMRFLRLERGRDRLYFWIWHVTSIPFFHMAIEGQISMLVFLPWLGFVWLMTRGREGRSGAVLALALVKPQTVLLGAALLVAKRRWLALKAFASVAGLLIAVSFVVSGSDAFVDYPRLVLSTAGWQKHGIFTPGMLGWNGFVASLAGDPPPLLLV